MTEDRRQIILAIDTSTENCSVALWLDGQVDFLSQFAPKEHTHILLPMIQSLLDRHHLQIQDCSAVAFGEGPGSFTGLRIAAGVAQGLAFAHHLPLIPVSTLAALALAAKTEYSTIDYFVPTLDARMHEVYFGIYKITNDTPIAIKADDIASGKTIHAHLQKNLANDWVGIGPAYQVYPSLAQDLTPHALITDVYPSAREIALLAKQAFASGQLVSPTEALPKYIRNNVAKKIKCE